MPYIPSSPRISPVVFEQVQQNLRRRARPSMNNFLNSIDSRNAFKPSSVKIVEGPNGTRMIAQRPPVNIPNNYKNIKNLPPNINSIREFDFVNVTDSQIIRFIMYTYYAGWDQNYEIGRRTISVFHRAISKLTTRDPKNTSRIAPSVLYRLLMRLNRETLVTLGKILEW